MKNNADFKFKTKFKPMPKDASVLQEPQSVLIPRKINKGNCQASFPQYLLAIKANGAVLERGNRLVQPTFVAFQERNPMLDR